MKDIIGKINWSKFGIEEFPDYIFQLSSPDLRTSRYAYIDWRENIKYEERVYYEEFESLLDNDLQIELARILVTGLENNFFPHKLFVLQLLADLQGITSYINQSDASEPYLGRAKLLRKILEDAYDVYIKIYQNVLPNIRLEILYRIRSLNIRKDDFVSDLLDFMRFETNLEIIEALIWFFYDGILPVNKDREKLINLYHNFLKNLIDNTDSNEIRILATTCLILVKGENVDDSDVEIVTQQYIECIPNMTRIFKHTNLSDLHIYTDALIQIGKKRSIFNLMKILQTSKNYAKLFLALQGILHILFSEGRLTYLIMDFHPGLKIAMVNINLHNKSSIPLPVVVHPIDDEAKQILKQLLKYNLLWEPKTNLFEIYGLPNERGKIAALVGEI